MSSPCLVARVLNFFYHVWVRIKSSITSSPFSWLDIFFLFISTASFVADIGTDVIVIVQYYIKQHYMWMMLTMSLVCVPSFLIQIFSIRWYILDGNCTNFIWAIHIMQLGVFNRYVELFKVGLRVRKSKEPTELSRFNQQQSDICMLRLFESFMESAPQLVLQLYIMVSMEDWNAWTGVSAIASVFSLSWGIAAYSKTMRNVRPEKKHLSWWGLIFQALWRIGTVSARIISFVLFAVVYGPFLLLIMFFHWLCMTLWVVTQRTDFCSTWWEEKLYNCIVGMIYCFCFFNLKEGRSRWRIASFYSLTSCQNVGFVLAYYFSADAKSHQRDIAVALVFVGMLIGLTSMLLYYRFFHPSGPIELCRKNKFLKTMVERANKFSAENCSNLKTSRKPNPSFTNECLPKDTVPQDADDNHVLPYSDGNMSVLSVQSNLGCQSDLHRSHSLNCSADNYCDERNFFFGYYRKRFFSKTQANHYRNINYNFRSAVAFGQQMSAFHCSCLVLMNNTLNHEPVWYNLYGIQPSISLPNLKSAESQDKNESPVLHFVSSTENTDCCSELLQLKGDNSSEGHDPNSDVIKGGTSDKSIIKRILSDAEPNDVVIDVKSC